jgi:hypothetical protein
MSEGPAAGDDQRSKQAIRKGGGIDGSPWPGARCAEQAGHHPRFDKSLTEIIKACQDQQFEFERQVLVNQARRAWQFVRGNHFSVPGAVDSQYGEIFDFVPYEGGNGPSRKALPARERCRRRPLQVHGRHGAERARG